MTLFSDNRAEAGQQTARSSFLSSGLFQGFRNMATRIKAAHFQPVVEAFCACAGRIAAENGRLKLVEVKAFRYFVIENQAHPILKNFPPEELAEKFKTYAIHAFLEEEEAFVRVLDPITPGSEEAQMIITGCLAVAFSDGVCDTGQRLQLEQLATRLGVETEALTQSMGVKLPPVSRASRLGSALATPISQPAQASALQQPVYSRQPAQASAPQRPAQPNPPPPAGQGGQQAICTLCQGKGCVFCNNTGVKS